MRLLCLASGRGSNFKAIAEACRSGEIPRSSVVALFCNKPDAGVIQIAKEKNIPVEVFPSGVPPFGAPPSGSAQRGSQKWDRAAFDLQLAERAIKYQPDYICLTGYLLLLGKPFLSAFPGRILNIHPSLLPLFPGLKAQKQALLAGAKETGCTVHLVDASLDGGPILAQNKVPIMMGDTEATLTERVLEVEHQTYVQVLKRLSHQEARITGNSVSWIQRP